MIVWGGLDIDGPVANGGIYDPEIDAWTSMGTAPFPHPNVDVLRSGEVSSSFSSGKFYIWGGTAIWFDQQSLGYLNSGAIYDLDTNTWSEMIQSSAPEGRMGNTAVFGGGYFLIWGGSPSVSNRGYVP
jgi:hypothetical protein